jgi:two-component system chemotaxis response regulator CheB
LLIKREQNRYVIQLNDGPQVNRHKPSVDVLFRSIAQSAGKNSVGYLLTGMGQAGARGLLEMREAQATTYAQSERTCAVFGMPGTAVKLGAAQHQIDLGDIAVSITNLS